MTHEIALRFLKRFEWISEDGEKDFNRIPQDYIFNIVSYLAFGNTKTTLVSKPKILTAFAIEAHLEMIEKEKKREKKEKIPRRKPLWIYQWKCTFEDIQNIDKSRAVEEIFLDLILEGIDPVVER